MGSIRSIPRSYHPKPRPSTPMDLFDISIVLYQKEFFEWIFLFLQKQLLRWIAVNQILRFNLESEGMNHWKSDLNELFWPVQFCHGVGTQVASCWRTRKLFVDSSSVLHQLFIISSSVLYQFFINSISVFHSFFNGSSAVLH